MISLIKLQASVSPESYNPTPQPRIVIGQEPMLGVARAIQCGCDALIFRHGNAEVAIPTSELWALVEAHEPALAPQIPAKV